MLKRFTTKELIFIALTAALLFIVNFALGSGINAATGIPGGSLFVTSITNMIMLVFVVLTVRKFGAVSIMYLIYSLLTIPTTMGGGPPGFLWKVPLIVMVALILDICAAIARYKPIGFIIFLPIGVVLNFGGYLLVFWLLGMTEFERLLGIAPLLAAVGIIEGYLGMWLGFKLYDKMKNKRLIKQITS